MDLFDILKDMEKGRFVEDSNRELEKVVEAVHRTGLKGKLTITLNVNPAPMDTNAPKLGFVGNAKSTVPMTPRDGTTLYYREGAITNRHPNQPDIKKIPNDTSGLNVSPDGQQQAAGDNT